MTKQSPKISVIVPVYNVQKDLSCCIDSILSQPFTDFELLLIDDGSKIIPVRFVMNMRKKILVYTLFIKKMEV